MATRTIAAGEFKQTCLALLDQVAAKHMEVIVTKRGKPVARVVPIQEDSEREAEVLAELQGRGRTLVDEKAFIAPTADDGGWSEDALDRS